MEILSEAPSIASKSTSKQLLDERNYPLSPLKSYLRQCRTARNAHFRLESEIRQLTTPHVIGFDCRKIGAKSGADSGPRRKVDGFFPPVKKIQKASKPPGTTTDLSDEVISGPYNQSAQMQMAPKRQLSSRLYQNVPDATQGIPADRPRPTFMNTKNILSAQPYSNLESESYYNYIGGEISYLPRPSGLQARKSPSFVHRQKIRTNQSLVARIMSGRSDTRRSSQFPMSSARDDFTEPRSQPSPTFLY